MRLEETLLDLSSLPNAAALVPGYRALPGRFDELLQNDPFVVAAWLHLLTEASELQKLQNDPNDVELIGQHILKRWRSVKHWLQEHNATLGSRVGGPAHRSWELDPIPLPIIEAKWRPLADGIAQRAHLLDTIMRDLYGPQRLIADGTIPLELIYGASAFIGSMQGTIAAGEPALYLYGVQLCRDTHGNWMAIADRTQGPSGGGYTIENRIALSRVLSEEFREFHVQRSATFFATLRDTVGTYASMRHVNARTILLSPGVRSDTFFEDAYLARYLGYTLAQTEDLTVRHGVVFQKTLTGLVPVQSIVRRVQDHQCDPLELSASIGVPGLCQAVRDGTVTIANPIGVGWGEMPAVAAMLPQLCRRVLGQDLLLPTIPMHWCGQAEALSLIRNNIDDLEIREALKRKEHSKIWPIGRSPQQRQELLNLIENEPWKYVGVWPLQYSTAPVWNNDKMEAWPMVMRGFATLGQGQKYQVLDGGIARLGRQDADLGASLGTGTISKDVWILGNSPPPTITLRKPQQMSLELRRISFDLPSRVAENLYWLGRWTQRAEGMIRHGRAVANRLVEETDVHLAQSYAAIFDSMDMNKSRDWSTVLHSPAQIMRSVRQRLHSTLFGQDNPHSLRNVTWAIESNMIMVRDRLSADSYNLLANLVASSVNQKLNDDDEIGDFLVELTRMLTSLSAFSGMVAENMTRGPGWAFLDMGVRIERVLNQLNVMRLFLVQDYAWMTPMLEAILEIMDSTMTYRFRYLMNVEMDPTIDLLLIDESNPRGIAYQLAKLSELATGIQQTDFDGIAEQKMRIGEAQTAIRLMDADLLSTLSDNVEEAFNNVDPLPLSVPTETVASEPSIKSVQDIFPALISSDKERHALAVLIDNVQKTVNSFSLYLSNRFFVHTADAQRLG